MTIQFFAKISFVQEVNKDKKKNFDIDSGVDGVAYEFATGGDTDGPPPEVPTSVEPTASVALAPTSGTPTAISCNAFTATSKDAHGATTAADKEVAFSLATTTGGGTFYSNSSCSSAITSATIPQGSTTKRIFYKNDNPGAISLVATYNGTAGTAYAITLGGPAVGSVTLLKGTTSACMVVVVTLRDSKADPMVESVTAPTIVTMTQDTTVPFSASVRNYYSDAGCTTSITSGNVTTATIPAGAQWVTIYLAPAGSAGTYAYDMSWSSGSSGNSGYKDSFFL